MKDIGRRRRSEKCGGGGRIFRWRNCSASSAREIFSAVTRSAERSENRRLGLESGGLEGGEIVGGVVEVLERGEVGVGVTESLNGDFCGVDAIKEEGRTELFGC